MTQTTRPRWQRAPESLQPGHKVEIRLSFKIGDPNYAHIEGLYKALAHGQMSKVLLRALEQGAQLVTKELLQQPGQAQRPAPQPSAPPAPRAPIAPPAAAASPTPQAQTTAQGPRPAGVAGRGLTHFQGQGQ